MEEEWKQIEGYENYSVSNFGNVRNDKTGKILKPMLEKGYYRVDLYKNKIQKHYAIHRLVGLHFLEKVEGKETIDHIDLCKTNNHINNLRFANNNEQSRNRDKFKNCSSIYKGVSWSKRNNKWKCDILINHKLIYLGYFDTELECAKRWNEEVIKHNLQEFYTLNEIPNLI